MVALASSSRVHASSEGSAAEQRAVARALRLVSLDRGVRVRLIDPELAGNTRALQQLDAFVVREPDGGLRPVVYLNRDSALVRRAAAGSDFHVHVLAAVIHHEARHLAGASEAEARRDELAFFRALVARGSVPPSVGQQYLQMLAAEVGAAPGR